MPWIMAGYSFLVTSYITTRICYANGRTIDVLVIETVGAISSLVIGLMLIYHAGLFGAAIAVPVYFGIQLLVSIRQAWPRYNSALLVTNTRGN
jgi:O-antigen/teichoic acid export membrane protein